MSNELFYSDRAAQMVLSGIEFIALVTALIIAGAMLISAVVTIWLGYSERRQRRG
jgi:hypothetical protein